MFWDPKKLEEDRKRRIQEQQDKAKQASAKAKAAKKQRALDLKKKMEKEQRWREEEEAEAAKNKPEGDEEGTSAVFKKQAPVLNRGFGFGGGGFQNGSHKAQAGAAPRPGIFRPNIPGLEGREQQAQVKGRGLGSGVEPSGSGTGVAGQDAASAAVSLRRPI